MVHGGADLGGFGPHWRSRPWQLVNSHTGEIVGAGVVSATGVSPVDDTGGQPLRATKIFNL